MEGDMVRKQLPSHSSGESMVMYPSSDPASGKLNDRNGLLSEAAGEADQTVADSIVYEVEWLDAEPYSGRRKNFRSEAPFGPLEVMTEVLSGHIQDSSYTEPAIRVVTTIRGSVPRPNDNDPNAPSTTLPTGYHPSSGYGSGLSFESIHFEDIKVTEVKPTRVIINNAELLREIRGVVKYFPAQNLTGDRVEIVEPYAVLVHHLDDFGALLDQLRARDDSKTTGKHLAALVQFLDQSIGPRISAAKARLSKPKPTVTFEDLWFLFKPGDDIYSYLLGIGSNDVLLAGVVLSTREDKPVPGQPAYTDPYGAPPITTERFLITLWVLESNGSIVSRQALDACIDRFEGERELTSLEAAPCRFLDSEDEGSFRRSLEERGKRLYELIRTQPKEMWYDGQTHNVATRTNQKYRGTAVVDLVAAINTAAKEPLPYPGIDRLYKYYHKPITFQSPVTDLVGQSLETFHWTSYHEIDVMANPELPSEHHYFLFTPLVPGFTLQNKTWNYLNIENLADVKSEASMDNVIIDQANRDVVQAVCHANSNPCKIDYISNKGQGQVVLLHGPPGVGKTYTVECIAQATKRPLIALTIGDLTVQENQIETRLVDWFSLAERWQAILLLDEADIFLERRATRDIQRNSIVSIFLRRMEYFRGLLFLTTNRVGQIDDAFLSRVTVVLQYDHLTDDTRKRIWDGFFKKLEHDGEREGLGKSEDNRKIEVDRYARKYILNDEDVKNLKWNGREIRNALQTAISLANYKAVKDGQTKDIIEVEEEHFKSVVAMSGKFKTYMEKIYNKDETGRARGRFERYDGPESRLLS
ncbi:MAG: hypothetical protein Q9218_006349 [Villophora microphyllina]